MNNNQNINTQNNYNSNPNGINTIPVNSPIPQNNQPQLINQMNVVPNNNQVLNQANTNQSITSNNVNLNNTMTNNDNNFFSSQSQVYNETSINDLNIDGAYNKMNVAPEYVNDQQVKENIVAPKKNTVPISKELKTVFIIALVLLAFIIVMPLLFDLLNNIRFH